MQLQQYHAVTYHHSLRVSTLSVALAKYVGLEKEEFELVRYGALLHDIGKMNIPLTILDKPGPLNESERDIIEQHPYYGSDKVAMVPGLECLRPLILFHHERWDGNGYPIGLTGAQIPYAARIIAIADAYDVITSWRVYKPKTSVAGAIKELERCAGTQLDPSLVEAIKGLLTVKRKSNSE
ncbi:hypothetical protein SY88_09750 [Clostridiales bacterium PH28_bin88]|nr:hypothetical protein SY88_09750 [Clostridiales bacterium PH28_bin88]